MFVVLGLGLIAFGLFALFRVEAMWAITEWSNSLKGVKSERTESWENMNGCSAVGAILMGIALIVISFVGG